MPSKKTNTARSTRSRAKKTKIATSSFFFPYLTFLLIMWVVYRSLFSFDVWFDELIGKAIFFGLPVWLYVSATKSQAVVDTFAAEKLYKGLLLGVAVGGLFGFAGSLAGIMLGTGQVATVSVFGSQLFWWEFGLALLTAIWETLFFFSWVMTVVMEQYKKWPLLNQALLVAGIFTIFHLPNTIIRFAGWQMVLSQAVLLFAFALGQAFFFSRWRNYYALVLSHALWGMVLLVHVM